MTETRDEARIATVQIERHGGVWIAENNGVRLPLASLEPRQCFFQSIVAHHGCTPARLAARLDRVLEGGQR